MAVLQLIFNYKVVSTKAYAHECLSRENF